MEKVAPMALAIFRRAWSSAGSWSVRAITVTLAVLSKVASFERASASDRGTWVSAAFGNRRSPIIRQISRMSSGFPADCA